MSYVYKQRFKTSAGCAKRVAEHNRHENQRPLRRCYFFSQRLILCADGKWRRDPLEYDDSFEEAGKYRWVIERFSQKEMERKRAVNDALTALGVQL